MASPFEHAWRLLKMPLNNPGYGDDHPAMEEPQPPKFSDYEPTPVPAPLQGREPSNRVHQSGRLPISREDIERLMQEGQRGQTPLGEPAPPPMPPQ